MDRDAAAKLTPALIEALLLVAEHRSSKRIAAALNLRHPDAPITHHAVKERLRRAQQALGAASRDDALDILLGRPRRSADAARAAEHPYGQEVYTPDSIDLDDLSLDHGVAQAGCRSGPQEVRDVVAPRYRAASDLPPRRARFRLTREKGEARNDLTMTQTIVAAASLAAALVLLAFFVMLTLEALSRHRSGFEVTVARLPPPP